MTVMENQAPEAVSTESPAGTLPGVGVHVSVVASGTESSGWLVSRPTALPYARVMRAHLVLVTGTVKEVCATREEWLAASVTQRDPLPVTISSLHRWHVERLMSIVHAAHEWADENELCGRFDEFLGEWALPTRDEREQEVRVRVSGVLTVPGRGRDVESAFQDLSREEIVAAARAALDDGITFDVENDDCF